VIGAGIDALVISTPPDRHVEWYERAAEADIRFFSEANVLTPHPEWAAARGATGCISATWRFHPLVHELRTALRNEEVLSVHHAYGGYLPAWHPWERYDEFYAGARRETCAAREMVPFELDWVCWAFGHKSPRWRKLYKRRSAVERENGRLKDDWGLNNVRVRGRERVQLHVDLCILARLTAALMSARHAAATST
jgi:predicted dehydrogenase